MRACVRTCCTRSAYYGSPLPPPALTIRPKAVIRNAVIFCHRAFFSRLKLGKCSEKKIQDWIFEESRGLQVNRNFQNLRDVQTHRLLWPLGSGLFQVL